LREAYSYLFGATLPDEANADESSRSEAATGEASEGEGGSLSLPWWRRNASGREEDPDYVRGREDVDELLGIEGDLRDRAFDSALEGENSTDVLETNVLDTDF